MDCVGEPSEFVEFVRETSFLATILKCLRQVARIGVGVDTAYVCFGLPVVECRPSKIMLDLLLLNSFCYRSGLDDYLLVLMLLGVIGVLESVKHV